MKRYEYVRVHIGKFIGAESKEHREIIDDYASRGFSYIGYIPVKLNDYGKLIDIDLVFEMEY